MKRKISRPSRATAPHRDSRSPIHETSAPSLRSTTFATEEFLPYLLNQLASRWNRNFSNDLKRLSVNARQWRVLAVLYRMPNLSLTELIEKTAFDQPTLSRMVEQLSLLNLLKRETAKKDARYLRLSLTSKGQALVEDIWPIAWKHYRRGAAELTPEEEAVLIKLLQRVLNGLLPA